MSRGSTRATMDGFLTISSKIPGQVKKGRAVSRIAFLKLFRPEAIAMCIIAVATDLTELP